ncbi:hypothetical protein EYC84_006655 [Monilinia fructicola]|uniref:Uncharacterized protein n=1 Tax=Monilinia fructicola TaxID=38448 RepID=A0A5M9K420_MONFR|nr:hypothetical protein EYC84_006655 [Monilinia fructicola]
MYFLLDLYDARGDCRLAVCLLACLFLCFFVWLISSSALPDPFPSLTPFLFPLRLLSPPCSSSSYLSLVYVTFDAFLCLCCHLCIWALRAGLTFRLDLDGMGWHGMGWHGMGWHGIWMGWHGLDWDGLGRIGMDWDGVHGNALDQVK